jgi:MFS family permease
MSQNAAASGPPARVRYDDEDAGRLNHASNTRIWTILVVLVLFSEVSPVQYAMVAPIIPKIGLAFPAAGASSTWALTIVGVVGAATLPLCGKASDLWAKKRLLLILAVLLSSGRHCARSQATGHCSSWDGARWPLPSACPPSPTASSVTSSHGG